MKYENWNWNLAPTENALPVTFAAYCSVSRVILDKKPVLMICKNKKKYDYMF